VFLVLALVLLLVLPWPWSAVGFGVGLVLFCGELGFWTRRVRGWRVRAGSETIIGERGRVVAACRPVGHVSVQGELWQARCDAGADAGDDVIVVGRDRLLLVVERDGAGSARVIPGG
jgi:membrane protein implicated in regulation of membrane protease activity